MVRTYVEGSHTNTRAATRQLRSRICILIDIVWSKGWWRSCLIEILAPPYNILIIIEQAIKLIRSGNCPVRRKEKTDGWCERGTSVGRGGQTLGGGSCIRVHITCWVVRLPGAEWRFVLCLRVSSIKHFRTTVDTEPSPPKFCLHCSVMKCQFYHSNNQIASCNLYCVPLTYTSRSYNIFRRDKL